MVVSLDEILMRIDMIKALIFDLDDTLYPEKEFVTSGFQAVAKYLTEKFKLDSSEVFDILKKGFDEGLRGKNFNSLLERLNLPQKELGELISVYCNHKPKIELYSDAKEVLTYFQYNKRIKIGLISDGPVRIQKNKLKVLKIDKIFDLMLLSDSLGEKYRKPCQKLFKLAIKKLKVKPAEAVYVADNPQKDFIGARKVGLFTTRIKRDQGIYKHIETTNENKADFTITNLIQIKKLCQTKK